MKIHLRKYFGFLSTTASILLAFLAFRSYQLIYSLIYLDENLLIILGRIFSLIAILLLSYLTYKRKIVAAWAMVFFLILSGFSIFSFGVFAVHMNQLALKIFSIISGEYFFYGGIVIFRSIRKGEMYNINTLKPKA
jgi:hypothetical protein